MLLIFKLLGNGGKDLIYSFSKNFMGEGNDIVNYSPFASTTWSG
jgi:hypothetical protein